MVLQGILPKMKLHASVGNDMQLSRFFFRSLCQFNDGIHGLFSGDLNFVLKTAPCLTQTSGIHPVGVCVLDDNISSTNWFLMQRILDLKTVSFNEIYLSKEKT